MGVANAIVWHPPVVRTFPAGLTGWPVWWPSAPGRFLAWNQPIWGAAGALAYALVWRGLGGPIRWSRVVVLWAGMVSAIILLGLMVRDGLIGFGHATAAAFWLYGLIGLFSVRDWVIR
ncbi:hypothetical protein CUV01_01335 [Paracoccus tegillarcae]|uniref:Uncharacterized protein n=1 Tax=Paracoccus tegillarcae TaxID=1529068 RepID=A0A2K9EBE4_9RHOB|nr:hypothetical protein CUV01_01335 [Paracoccus tegillarcae]